MNFMTKKIIPAALGLAAATVIGMPDGAQASERVSTLSRSDQIVIRVDKSDQEMTVIQGGRRLYSWPVSTGAGGYDTPVGTYQPTWFSRDHHSRQYGGAPMPFAIFFYNGYAIHATFDTWALGRRASHGCVRLSPEHASELYEVVYDLGKDDTYVVIQE